MAMVSATTAAVGHDVVRQTEIRPLPLEWASMARREGWVKNCAEIGVKDKK